MSCADSAMNSPVINRSTTGNIFHFSPSPTPKPVGSAYNDSIDGDEDDLYQTMNGHLFEIEECVQNIYKLKQMKPKARLNKARLSGFNLMQLLKDRKSVEDDEEDTKEGKEEEVETVSKVLDQNEEKQQLYTIDDVIERAKQCVSEMHQQQVTIRRCVTNIVFMSKLLIFRFFC